MTAGPVRTAQNHQLVMPVGFPDQLAVARDLKVTVVYGLGIAHGCLFAAAVVAVPIDRFSHVAIFEVEKTEAMVNNLICLIEQSLIPLLFILPRLRRRPFSESARMLA
jgi:hypothetical protein